jgi:hypothetical protein
MIIHLDNKDTSDGPKVHLSYYEGVVDIKVCYDDKSGASSKVLAVELLNALGALTGCNIWYTPEKTGGRCYD